MCFDRADAAYREDLICRTRTSGRQFNERLVVEDDEGGNICCARLGFAPYPEFLEEGAVRPEGGYSVLL